MKNRNESIEFKMIIKRKLSVKIASVILFVGISLCPGASKAGNSGVNNCRRICSDDSVFVSKLIDAISNLDEAYSNENLFQLANTCERIIAVRPKMWLAYYWEAYAFINLSSSEKEADTKDAYSDKAEKLIDSALKIAPDESELYVLQALMYFTKMEVNSMSRGMLLMPKANKSLEKAAALNPKNPRIYFLEGKSAYNRPEFMGGGKDVALPLLAVAVELYKKLVPQSEIFPSWGAKGANELYEICIAED